MVVGSQTWLGITLLTAMLDWIAVGLAMRPLEYVAKPATLAATIGYARALRRKAANPRLARWVEMGLALSLWGDVCLMFEGEAWFLAGLVGFLLAHLAYIAAFTGRRRLPRHPALFLIVVGVIVVNGSLLFRIVISLYKLKQIQITIPIAIYATAISAMWISGLVTLLQPRWSRQAKGVAIIGSSLFCLSDGILAWNRFVTPIRRGALLTIIPYHIAQITLATVIARAPSDEGTLQDKSH
jgi:uncharacterized membrane protein YhhN